jgi:hypothetical protein
VLGLLSSRYLFNLWRQPIALFGASKFLFRKFARLTSDSRSNLPAEPPAPTTSSPQLLSTEITSNELRAVRASCQKVGVSLNDWLVGCLFEAVWTWKSGQSNPDDRPWLRMIIPISIRRKEDATMPAANRSTLVQLDRRKEDFSPRVRLMQGVRFELGLIRSWQLDRILLIVIRGIAISHRLLKRCTRWNHHRATTMLTNLGKPLLKTGLPRDAENHIQFGDLTLSNIDLVAPIKNGMPASFAAHQYCHGLRITMQYDSEVMTREQAGGLLQGLAERVRTFEI